MLWTREKHTVPPGTVLDLSCLLPPGASTGAGLSACHPPVHQLGQLESSACALQCLRPGLTVLDQTGSACKLFAISEEARKTNRAGQCPGPGQAWRKPRHRGHPGKGECHSEAATTAGQEPPEPGDSRMDDGVSPEPLYATQREACKKDGWEDRANTDAEVG